MGDEEAQVMSDYLMEHTNENASDFIRNAVRAFSRSEDGIFVRLSEVHLNTLAGMKEDGTIFSEEEFARKCILDAIVPTNAIGDSAERAFKRAQMSAQLK